MLQKKNYTQIGWWFKMGEITWKTKEEIDAELQKLSPIQELEKTQTDLVFSLMMNGVI